MTDFKMTSDMLRESAKKLQGLAAETTYDLKLKLSFGELNNSDVLERLEAVETMQEAAQRLYAAADIFNLIGAVPGEGESTSKDASTGE